MNFRVNRERLQFEIDRFGSIGATAEGGVSRLAFTELELDAKRLLQDLLEELGVSVRYDAFGNLFGRRESSDPLLPVILFGSHLDTVPNGGKYDGALGVLASLELLRVLDERKITTHHPLELVCFSCEESSRFGAGVLGSKAMTGLLAEDNLHSFRDTDGISLYQALCTSGFAADNLGQAKRDMKQIACYLELHIEQGPVLEDQKIPVGVVSGIANATRFAVEISGRADHSGTTPMSLRRDALLGAAEVVIAVERAVKEAGGLTSVATVGVLQIEPGAINVVPGTAKMRIDVRDIDAEAKQRVASLVKQRTNEIAQSRGLGSKIELIADGEPIPLSDDISRITTEAAERLGIPFLPMHSGAGHDAMNIAPFCPTGMIFVPSKEGRSHSPLEFTHIDDIVPGVEVMLETVLALDKAI